MTQTLSRPELTLPEQEAAALRAAYAASEVILEYGSGGSTVMAAEMPGKTVFSVESDRDWAEGLRAWFKAHPPAPGTEVDVIWSDIGPTKEWGHPKTDSAWRRWPRYALEVWSERHFRQPDVVLVDGRFRLGCALAAAYLSTKPVTIFFDDYVQRDFYHKVEAHIGAPTLVGRMAQFHVTPKPIPPQRLLQMVNFFLRP